MESLLKKMKDLDQEEREKLRRYLKETKDGNDERMEWMYKGDKPDCEEYLLGKMVDKHIEGEASDQEKSDVKNPSFEEVIKRRADIDMKTKMREDPLYQIKMREEESRKRLLQNPIKMKQLQTMLEEKKEKSKKKEKRKKKKKHSNNSSSDDSDEELLEKYLSIIKEKKTKNNVRDVSHSKKHSSENHSEHKHLSDVESRRLKNHSTFSHHLPPKRSYDRSSSSDVDHGSYMNRDDSNDEGRSRLKGYGLIGVDKKKKGKKQSPKRRRSRSRSPIVTKSRIKSLPKRKLSKDEMDRKRLEMMENARWRDEQREKNVKSFKAQDDQEEMTGKVHTKGKSADFINPMMARHVGESSVEDRIKRNIYNIQRTSASLDKKFTQK